MRRSGAILAAKPIAYWRLDEFAGPIASDSSGHNLHAVYDAKVAYFLGGPRSDAFCTDGEENRAAHLAGGRLQARIESLGEHYAISMWFWNGLPTDARDVSGWLISRGPAFSRGESGEHVGVGGGENHPGKIMFHNGTTVVAGRTSIERWTWNHLLFVCDGVHRRVYLNGEETPEIDTVVSGDNRPEPPTFFFGGHCSGDSSWEGRLDEIAIFDRPMAPSKLYIPPAN